MKSSASSISPDHYRMLEESDLHTLFDLLGMCKMKGLPRAGLVEEIEKEIYRKWVRKNHLEDSYTYKITPKLYYTGKIQELKQKGGMSQNQVALEFEAVAESRRRINYPY